MLSQTIFKIGPFNICFWNIVFLVLIFLVATILRRYVHRFLKQYLTNANISLEGRRVTWLKLASQSVYIFALYFAVISFQFNNKDITFEDFLDFKLINLKSFNLSFYHILVIVSISIGTRMLVNFDQKQRKMEVLNMFILKLLDILSMYLPSYLLVKYYPLI